MDNVLWNKILQFDLDNPPSEFGFSVRLAQENFWTKAFTQKAILEYKKFMYLASVSESMVSPSEIVDTVWHLHLIFSQSYQDFCNLIGKQIQHIPSTHNRDDFKKFKEAKEQTDKLYETTFGIQPKDIWEFYGMYESLNLDKAKNKLRDFIVKGIIVFYFLGTPLYYILEPIYVKIDNPYFLIGFITLSVITFKILDLYNKAKLKKITQEFDQNSFIYDLQPYELIYLKTEKISEAINGAVNELIDKNIVEIHPNHIVNLVEKGSSFSDEQNQITKSLTEFGKSSYPTLVNRMKKNPVFFNITNVMDAFKRYFIKSKKFHNLFYLNFIVLSLVFMLGYTRLLIGFSRDKAVGLIIFVLIVLAITTIYFLNRLTKLICTHTIPNLYKSEILPAQQIENNWQWNYFLLGTAVMVPAFVPLIEDFNKNHSASTFSSSNSGSSCGSSSNSCGSSCSGSSSCGSSCGSSSCGGCGGGD